MTPQLYIEIDHIVKSGQSGTQALSHMLMGNNPGLPFLTKLKLTLARGRPNEEWSMQSQPVRELLLMHIRPNQLKELL